MRDGPTELQPAGNRQTKGMAAGSESQGERNVSDHHLEAARAGQSKPPQGHAGRSAAASRPILKSKGPGARERRRAM